MGSFLWGLMLCSLLQCDLATLKQKTSARKTDLVSKPISHAGYVSVIAGLLLVHTDRHCKDVSRVFPILSCFFLADIVQHRHANEANNRSCYISVYLVTRGVYP